MRTQIALLRLLLAIVLPILSSAAGEPPAADERLYLSGTDKDHTVPWDFRVSAGRRAGEWATVPVPGCWEMHGFGNYRYGGGGPDEKQAEEYGEYRKSFDVPAAWKGRRVFIVFEGAMTEAETLVNGLPAGGNIHRGGFYEFSHEITGQLKFGAANLLKVTVRKTSADAALNAAEREGDYWNFGGLFRPVYLESRPAAHIERIAVDARHDGALTVDLFPSGLDRAAVAVAQVGTLDGTPVGPEFNLADYAEDQLRAFRWLGRGPDHVWKNRLAGPTLGVHRKTANNTNTGQQWDYPEFRGYHAGLRWASLENAGPPVLLVTDTPDLFLRVLTWPESSATHPGLNVPAPPGDLSLLHGINAIGHKFGDAASLGPQGLPNLATGRYAGAVDFFFGPPPSATSAC